MDEGTDCSVGILGEHSLPVIRVETERPFYDYEAKYQSDTTRYQCPPVWIRKRSRRCRRWHFALFAISAAGAGAGWT